MGGLHNRSGYYAWLRNPRSNRARRDERQIGLVKQAWLESGGVYGYRKIHCDLVPCGVVHWVTTPLGYCSLDADQQDINDYFMRYYNWLRPHAANNGVAPAWV